MKDNLFELLLSLFEQSLTQLQKDRDAMDLDNELLNLSEDEQHHYHAQSLHLRAAGEQATRVLTYEEQMKMTKASYQFLMKMKLYGVIDNECFELIMHQIHRSESRIVTLQETKWVIRTILSETFNEKQLAFLDLVLYAAKDKLVAH